MGRKTVGIIGGMGPHSTIRLFELIVDRTPVNQEQDHLRILIDNRPQIPDRTAHILGHGPSPVPMLQESARLLEQWGANIIAMACNTAHFFWNEVQHVVTVPVLNMIEQVARVVQRLSPGPMVLLATTGTLRSGLYQHYIPGNRLQVPDEALQREVMEVIYGPQGVKMTGPTAQHRTSLEEIVEQFNTSRPVGVIAGCTEIELALGETVTGIPVLKPLEILAEAIVAKAISEE